MTVLLVQRLQEIELLLPAVTPAAGKKTVTFTLTPLSKIDELFALFKRREVLYSTRSQKRLLPHKIG